MRAAGALAEWIHHTVNNVHSQEHRSQRTWEEAYQPPNRLYADFADTF
jgi:NADH:ubiquinone oxidoreductase subunit